MNDELSLCGLQVLIVEDMFLIASDLSDQLKDAGCDVIGPASSVKQALQQIHGRNVDGAVLDINLGAERSFPVAEVLSSRRIPFLFLSGYDSASIVPEEFACVPRLAKPVDAKTLRRAVGRFRRT